MISSRSTFATMLAVSAFAMFCLPVMAHAVTICRGPGFYQTHSGEEKDGPNIAEEIIQAVDGFDVCGHHIINTTEIGGLDSVLEGMCVRTQGVDQRQLYRQLLTAKMNCLVSEGANCDDITDPFVDVNYSDCDAHCAGFPVVDGPSVEECIDQLACFNGGGRIIEGSCVKGTCGNDGVTNCSNDEDCGVDGDCVRFEDSCANSQFCSEDLVDAEAQICPKKGPATSPMICRDARRNGCTIDDIACYQACTGEGPCIEACEATPGCVVAEACADVFPCLETCFFLPFGDGSPCGCEFSWVIFCEAVTGDPGDFLACFFSYAEAEASGFCQECAADPLSCVAP